MDPATVMTPGIEPGIVLQEFPELSVRLFPEIPTIVTPLSIALFIARFLLAPVTDRFTTADRLLYLLTLLIMHSNPSKIEFHDPVLSQPSTRTDRR